MLIVPGDIDVLCGRGGRINKHHGNRNFRAICKPYRPAYQAIKGKGKVADKKKDCIVEKILKTELEGVRFLKMNEEGFYELLPEHKIIGKVKQYLRTKLKSKKSKNALPSNGKTKEQDILVTGDIPTSRPNQSAGDKQAHETAGTSGAAKPATSYESALGIQVSVVEDMKIVTDASSSKQSTQEDEDTEAETASSSHLWQGDHMVAADAPNIDAADVLPPVNSTQDDPVPEQTPNDLFPSSSGHKDSKAIFNVDSFINFMEPASVSSMVW